MAATLSLEYAAIAIVKVVTFILFFHRCLWGIFVSVFFFAIRIIGKHPTKYPL